MSAHDVPEEPWDVVFMDETSGFPDSNGMDAIWVFMDKLSKMVHFVPVKKLGLTSEELGYLYFTQIFRLHGLPRIIVSDRDARISDDFWRTLFRLAGVRLNMSTPMHPQTDSSGEAAVKICVDLCRQFVNSNRDDWCDLLPALEFAYNSTPGSSGHSPFEIDGLRQPRSAQSLLIDATLRNAPPSGRGQLSAQFLRRYSQVLKEARATLRRIAEDVELPERTVLHRKRDDIYEPGDCVLLRREQAGTSFPQDKMAKLYVGPFEIEARVGKKSYRLKLPPSMRVNPVQDIDSLWRPDPRIHFPPREIIEEGDPDEPLPRLTEDPVVITKLFFETLEDETIEIFADTPLGRFKIHDLCIHQHYEECVSAIAASADVIRRWPFSLGRLVEQRYWRHPGFISAYDPNDSDKAFQLEFVDPRDSYWAPREAFTVKRLAPAAANAMLENPRRRQYRPLRALELCCGSKSFTRQLRRMFPNAEIITLDITNYYKPDIQADISTWNYLDAYPIGYFDIIWVSPPCTEYSPAKSGHPRDLLLADRIARAALDIIRVARPRVWFLENPHTMLYKRGFMLSLNNMRHRCTYCKYGFRYKKDTDIWSNVPMQLLHCDDSPCAARAADGIHQLTAQQGLSGPHQTPGVPRQVANFIPPRLLRVLIHAAINHIKTCTTARDEKITWK